MRTTPSLHSRRGGVMIIALVAIGIITVGFTAWVGLLAQRGRTGEVEEHAARRRLSAYNSRNVIREYALERMITSSGDANGVSFDPLAGWSVTSAPTWSGYPMESNTRYAGLNAFSLSWDYPYSKILDTTSATKALGYIKQGNGRMDETYTASASYLKTYIRSRSPILGGDILVVHRSSLTPPVSTAVTGNINVYGRVLHFLPDLSPSSYSARSLQFLAAPAATAMTLQPRDLNGNNISPTNLAWTPVTFGRSGGVTDLTGKLNVIDDPTNGGNSLRQKVTARPETLQNGGATALSDPRGYNNDGNGIVTIIPCIGPANPSDIPSIVINSEVQEIIIEGQDGTNFDSYARYRPAMAIVYVQDEASTRKLTTIRLRKQDRRRVILAIKQKGNTPGLPVTVIVEDTNATSEWHLVILAENTPLIFTAATAVTNIKISGGIQTDAPLVAPGAAQGLSLVLESDTRGLIRMTPRAAWVETIMPDKIPGTSNDNTW